MIKIDTEGFELFVLKGLQNFFEDNQNRPVIICEITPRANSLMGIRLDELSDYMHRYNYKAYSLLDMKTKIDVSVLKEQTDVLFLPVRQIF